MGTKPTSISKEERRMLHAMLDGAIDGKKSMTVEYISPSISPMRNDLGHFIVKVGDVRMGNDWDMWWERLSGDVVVYIGMSR